MIRYSLAAAITLAMMTGAVLAQTSSSSVTSTQSTTSSPVPVPGVASVSNSRQTTDSNGVVTDETQTYTSGTTLAPTGPVATTRKTTETTTTR